jgi:glycosyltransferase involved in cell wall biosynthesis
MRWARTLNQLFLRFQIRSAMRKLGFNKPTTWTFVPTSADVVGTLGEKLIVYHCVDEYAAFSDAAPEIAARERDLIAKADLVLASASDLLESKKLQNPSTFLLTHGVDHVHFRRASQDETVVAADIASLPKPVLGFHGLIADWVDLKLIADLARLQPSWSIVLIGKADTDLSPIKDLPNVHLLGHRAYSDLPAYLKGFDFAILPFVNNQLTRSANPLKLREYLSAGLPVIAVPIPEVKRFKDEIYLADSATEYVNHVVGLMQRGGAGPLQLRSDRMASESWQAKAEQAEQFANESLSLKSKLAHR